MPDTDAAPEDEASLRASIEEALAQMNEDGQEPDFEAEQAQAETVVLPPPVADSFRVFVAGQHGARLYVSNGSVEAHIPYNTVTVVSAAIVDALRAADVPFSLAPEAQE